MLNLPNGKITIGQLLLPVTLIAFVVFIMLAFQLTQILHDRQAMHEAMVQQQKPVEDASKVDTQFKALLNGTLELANKGDKGARAIVARMRKLGILGGPNPQQAQAPGAGQSAPDGSTLPGKPMPPSSPER